jgi:hypothetical protein
MSILRTKVGSMLAGINVVSAIYMWWFFFKESFLQWLFGEAEHKVSATQNTLDSYFIIVIDLWNLYDVILQMHWVIVTDLKLNPS